MRMVRCYYNLHKKVWSVQDYSTRRLLGHATKVNLVDVKFQVSEAGRQRVLKTGRKNVHAFVTGVLTGAEWTGRRPNGPLCEWCADRDDYKRQQAVKAIGDRVTYNPRLRGNFYHAESGCGVKSHYDWATLTDDRQVWVC